MTVEPRELKSVVAHRVNRVELHLNIGRGLDELNRTFMALAAGARAIPTQNIVRIHALVTVTPIDFAYFRAAGGSKGLGSESRVHRFLSFRGFDARAQIIQEANPGQGADGRDGLRAELLSDVERARPKFWIVPLG